MLPCKTQELPQAYKQSWIAQARLVILFRACSLPAETISLHLASSHDGMVSSASAEVAVHALHEVLSSWPAPLLLRLGHGSMASHNKAGGAVSTLRSMMPGESLCKERLLSRLQIG